MTPATPRRPSSPRGTPGSKVSTAVAKHYKTGKIGSTTYYYFHKKTDPVFTTTMNYYKGRKQRLQLQVHYRGACASTSLVLGPQPRAAPRGRPGSGLT
ncbi:hypothetical protein SVIOM342S_03296 [Streptomyces violaceorubidus]